MQSRRRASGLGTSLRRFVRNIRDDSKWRPRKKYRSMQSGARAPAQRGRLGGHRKTRGVGRWCAKSKEESGGREVDGQTCESYCKLGQRPVHERRQRGVGVNAGSALVGEYIIMLCRLDCAIVDRLR